MRKHSTPSSADNFTLTAEPEAPFFELLPDPIADASNELQTELYLPLDNPEQPEDSPQIAFKEMQPVRHEVTLVDHSKRLHFQHAQNLLESLEAQGVDIHFQCREGYCGSCRVRLLQGKVHYLFEPMAWLNEGEVLTCCTVPKTDITIEVPSH